MGNLKFGNRGWSALAALMILTLPLPTARGDAKRFYFERQLQQKLLHRISERNFLNFATGLPSVEFAPMLPPSPSPGIFKQKINHNDPQDLRTFDQRYYVSSDYASGPNAPVLYYICGESTCTSSFVMGAISKHAKLFGAHMVALEHRYYGKSIPTPTLAAKDLEPLTIDAALQDLAAFQEFFSTKLGLTGKVITIGGSYPATLSAYYRSRYPRLAAGALASSAPVLAKANFEEYDLHVTKMAGPDCANALRMVTAAVEKELKSPASALALRKRFTAEKVTDDEDFLYLVADIGAAAVQYGMREDLCNRITPAGLSATERLDRYAQFGKELFSSWGMTAYDFSLASAFDENPNSFLNGFGMRSWLYQSCTEFGFFQNAYHDALVTVRSTRINPAYHARLCDRLFGIKTPVKEEETNRTFYEPLLNPRVTSQILFTNGSEDPWSVLSIDPSLGNGTNPGLSTAMIAGAAHCDDLGSPQGGDSTALKDARKLFVDLATDWLK